jgi:hypothetical protein
MNVKVKEIILRYGQFEVQRPGYDPEPCFVARKGNVLYFHTDMNIDDIYDIASIIDGYEWKCGVERFKRIIERLSNKEDVENDTGSFEQMSGHEYGIMFTAPCGEQAYVKLATLKEVDEKFGDAVESPADAVS